MTHIPVGWANYQLLMQMPGGRPALCSMGFIPEAAGVEGIMDGLTNAAGTDWWSNIDDSYRITGARVIVGTSDPSSPVTLEVSQIHDGGNPGEAVAPNTAYLISKRTLRGGRKGRGRQFFPGVPTDYVGDDGVLSPSTETLSTQWATFWQTLLADISDQVGQFTSYLLHTDASDGPPDLITDWAVQAKVATQRRRLRR